MAIGHLPCINILLYNHAGLIWLGRFITGCHLGAASRKAHAAGTENLRCARHPQDTLASHSEYTIGYPRPFNEAVETSS